MLRHFVCRDKCFDLMYVTLKKIGLEQNEIIQFIRSDIHMNMMDGISSYMSIFASLATDQAWFIYILLSFLAKTESQGPFTDLTYMTL